MKKYFNNLYLKDKKNFFKEVYIDLKSSKKKFIVTANPELFMYALEDKIVENILMDKSIDVVSDGIGIIKAAKMIGVKIPERIPGVDLALELLEYGNKLNKSIYLFGATEEVVSTLVNKININYPNLNIVGYRNGYVVNKDYVFRDILRKEPDIVLVALGMPLQEKLIYRHIKKFRKGIFVGVGGSFDVLSGFKKRAPKIFIKLNLEWLYRIIREPKRIKRFYKNNIKFMFKIIRLKIKT